MYQLRERARHGGNSANRALQPRGVLLEAGKMSTIMDASKRILGFAAERSKPQRREVLIRSLMLQ